MFPDLTGLKKIAIDVETTGLSWHEDEIFGIAITTCDRSYYWDTRDTPECLEWLRDSIRALPLIVNHNIKFDMHMLWNKGVTFDPARADCTMIRANLIDEHLFSYSLDALATKYLKAEKLDIYEELAEMFGGHATRNAQIGNLHRAPAELVGKYAMRDTELAWRLWEWQEKSIEIQKLEQVTQFERQLFPHIFDMERRGVRVDTELAERTSNLLKKRAEQIQKKVSADAGFEVNPNPSGSIHQLFQPKKNSKTGAWVARDGTVLPETEGGKPSIGAEQLQAMTDPVAAEILKCRKFMKASGTFLDKHVIEKSHNGRVHPNINQVKGEEGGTGTGRMSYTQPALQQIPNRDREIAAMVRPMFLPDEGQGWSYGDLDQHEFRWFVHYIQNKQIMDMYAKNPDTDFHTLVSEVMGVPRNRDEVTGLVNAKQLNLGMIFNMGEGTLCRNMGYPSTTEVFKGGDGKEHHYYKAGPEGQAIIDEYHRLVPGIRQMTKDAKNVAVKRGFVKTIKGRHLRFPQSWMARKAAGLLYQGTSAEANKMNIIAISEILSGTQSNLLLNIHDEYSMSLHPDDVHLLHDIKHVIENNPHCKVPIRIDFSETADNWWDATIASKYT